MVGLYLISYLILSRSKFGQNFYATGSNGFTLKALECNDEEITHTIHAHPTLSEAAMEATLNVFQEAIHI